MYILLLKYIISAKCICLLYIFEWSLTLAFFWLFRDVYVFDAVLEEKLSFSFVLSSKIFIICVKGTKQENVILVYFNECYIMF